MLATPTDVDYLTISLNAGETLTLVGTPTTSSLQLVLTVLDPSSNVIGTATAPAQGANAVIETVTDRHDRHLHDRDQRCQRQPGPVLDPGVLEQLRQARHANISIATARTSPAAPTLLGPGSADRLAVVGSLPANAVLRGRRLRIVPVLRLL